MPYPKEELLHHIWQHRLFDNARLVTTDGQRVELLKPGTLNLNAGPDFSAARLNIGKTEWSGNVEIHVRSSDWLKHGHQQDAAYANIILHVVFEDDLNDALGAFPTLELKSVVSDQVLGKYQLLIGNNGDGLACGSQFMEVPSLVINNWIDSLIIARLARKSESINKQLDATHGDLEQAFQIILFRAFGMKVNAVAFELLGLITPWKTLAKYRDNLFQLEAILFGNAGLLKFPEDDYQKKLSKEFDFLENKHGIGGLDTQMWKFSQMHPKNFPTLRLAQLASLYHRTGSFFSWFRNKSVAQILEDLLVDPSAYWQSHYRFGKEFPKHGNRLGSSMAQNILINVLVPFLFILSERESKPELRFEALSILEQLKPEKNVKTRLFEAVGFKASNALETQALIELETNYCRHKKCLSCNVGANILKREL